MKKVNTLGLTDEKRFLTLMARVSEIDAEVFKLQEEKIKCQTEMAEIKIKPFKVGDEVMCEVSAGRTKKVQKCVIEVEDGMIYVRPYKNDGELSNRHFNIPPEVDYQKFFKKV